MKKVFAALFCLLLAGNSLNAQSMVSTVVDSSAFGFTDDLIFDNAGNLYRADYSGDAVYKRTPGGVITTFLSGLSAPNGLAFDSAENLFVCDNVGNTIYKLDYSGVFLDTFQINSPSGIIKDAVSDTMIFTTYAGHKLKKLAPDGTILDFHAGTPLQAPVGLEYHQGGLYVANFSNRKIYKVEQDTLIFITQLPGYGSLGIIAYVGDVLLLQPSTHTRYAL